MEEGDCNCLQRHFIDKTYIMFSAYIRNKRGTQLPNQHPHPSIQTVGECEQVTGWVIVWLGDLVHGWMDDVRCIELYIKNFV